MKRLSFSIILILLIIAASDIPQAKVTGVCSDCHTMHYSQHGGTLSEWGESGPYEALTVDTCVGCHSGDAVSDTGTPVVLTTSAPNKILAGGNFYYVTVADANGHNVKGIGGVGFQETPPGYTLGKADTDDNIPGGGSWPDQQQVTCAGYYGCHGRHNSTDDTNTKGMKGAHHGDEGSGSYRNGDTLSKSYRFLNGIKGVEDSDWEYSTGDADHNWYQGATDFATDSTISYLCAECHDDYHNGLSDMAGADSHWKRHPSDVLLSKTQGYSSYDPTTTYDNDAPVAYTDPTSPSNATAVVMCLSCHRAHASPNGSPVPMFRSSTALPVCNKCHNQ